MKQYGRFDFRDDEKIIAAYNTDANGYLKPSKVHRPAEILYDYYVTKDYKIYNEYTKYPSDGYITNYGQLINSEAAIAYCRDKGHINDWYDSELIKRYIGKDYDIPKAKRFCEEYNHNREERFLSEDAASKDEKKLGGGPVR